MKILEAAIARHLQYGNFEPKFQRYPLMLIWAMGENAQRKCELSRIERKVKKSEIFKGEIFAEEAEE
jgi:hypothetical protein